VHTTFSVQFKIAENCFTPVTCSSVARIKQRVY